ncbi:MAG: YibE/F family protein [Spirochaetes bacterium]|nr:YibE/F family protein [Spirochaetota bacterium]
MKLKRELIFSIVIAILSILLYFLDIGKIPEAPGGTRSRGLITDVNNSRVRTNLIVKTNAQYLTVKLLDGPFKGDTIQVVNMLTGKMEIDEFYVSGRTILVEYNVREGKPVDGIARGYYRLRLQLILICLFTLLLIAIAGVTGLKAALSFIFAAIVLWKLFFPLLLFNFSPIWTGLGIVSLLTGVICFSVGGMTYRGMITYSGSMLGVFVTCGLAVLFNHMFHLHGAVRPFAEMLLYSGYYDLNLSQIFIASVFIACSGAVMDLSMDIAATMDELKHQYPKISLVEHMHSGLRVSRAVVGTMTTTLLLAYSGSHITMFMIFIAKGLPPENLLNAPFVAAEILNILVGSFGVVTVAPFTVLVSALIYRYPGKKLNKEQEV